MNEAETTAELIKAKLRESGSGEYVSRTDGAILRNDKLDRWRI